MEPGSKRRVFGPIGRLFRTGTAAGLSDAQLLERFVLRHDEAAEAAFAAIVERHGPMVLSVCRRVLNDPHDAQDAFQATFLVLVRKAGSVRKRESIADWLHGVALRISAHAWADSARRRAIERRAGTGTSTAYETTPTDWDVWDEVGRLPQDLRSAVVLCYLEGLTHDQAARRLGWPVGTVRSRLARARDRLRSRLTRRGLAPDAAFLPVLSFKAVSLPEGFIDPTVKAAMLVAARDAAQAGLVSASAAALTEGVLRTMLVSKLKSTAASLVAAGAIASGVGLYAYQVPKTGANPGTIAPSPERVNIRRLDAAAMIGYAEKLEAWVQLARRAHEIGDIDGTVQALRRIELLAGEWREALTNRTTSERDDLPVTRPRPARTMPPLPHADQPVLPPPSDPSPRPVEERPEPGRNSQSASAAQRLDELERKVERLVRALDKNAGEDTARRGPADPNANQVTPPPPSVEGLIQKIDDRTGRVAINLGSDDGLTRGHELAVYRRVPSEQSPGGVELLGRIRILGSNPDQSAAKVIEIQVGKKIKEGDRVSARATLADDDYPSSETGRKR